MENTPSPQQTAGQAPLQAVVDYLPGVSIFGAKPALLEWGADGRIRLFEMDFDTNVAKSVIFDAAINEITKATGTMVMITFVIAGKKYNTQFSQTAVAKSAGGGIVGMALGMKETDQSGINVWIKKLQDSGVAVRVMGWGWAIKWALIGSAALIALIVVIVLLTM
jgi:hypothetical protein